MNPATQNHRHLWIIAFAVLAVFFAAGAQSFWIDEAITARFSVQPTFAAWVHMMLTERGGSDPQMPFYLGWTWLWEKVFGHGEWALRLSGWPWLAAGIALFGWRKPVFAAVCAVSAFIWFYADEARPYAMQAGLALALMRAAMNLAEGKLDRRAEIFWQLVLIGSGVLLATSHLLGMFWTAAYWGFCLLCVPTLRNRDLLKKTLAAWLVAFVLLVAVSGYYFWTLKTGLRATDAGITDLRNVFYALYELLGFGGLGPGRLEIREAGLAAFKPFAAQLFFGALVTLPLVGMGAVELFRRLGKKNAAILLAATAGTMVFILLIGVEKHFRVLARHLTPLLPIFLWLLAAGAERLWQRRGMLGKCVVTAWALLAIVSCLEIHFAARHAKDDYRSAAAVANAALQKNQVVWWNADFNAAWYYAVPLGDLNVAMPDRAVRIASPSPELLAALPRPALIITTKPDLYDVRGELKNFAATNGWRVTHNFMAFTVWEK